MNYLFEFGEYWDTGTFIMFLILGFFVAFLAKKASKIKGRNLIGIDFQYKQENNKIGIIRFNPYYFSIFIILLFVFSFRDSSVGADTQGYIDAIRETKTISFTLTVNGLLSSREPLFLIVSYLLQKITTNYTVYLFFWGIIISYAYTKYIKVFWNDKNAFVFLVMFVAEFHYGLNVLRTAIGAAFVLLSLCAYAEKKTKKSIILGICAVMFHYTAIVHMPLLILLHVIDNYEKIGKKKAIIFLILGSALTMFIIPYALRYFVSTRYHKYVETLGAGNVLGRWYVIITIAYSIILLFKKKNGTRDEKITIITCAYNIILLLLNVFLGAYRVINLYTMPRISLWSANFPQGKGKVNRFVYKIVVMSVVIVYLLFRMSRNSASPGFAYHFIWG